MKNIHIAKYFVLFAALIALTVVLTGCGKTYTCTQCGKTVKVAYYDPYNANTYYCGDCAPGYFAPFPYTAYRVK